MVRSNPFGESRAPGLDCVNRLFSRVMVIFDRVGRSNFPHQGEKMKPNYKIGLLSVAVLLAVSTFAQEKKIKRSELPAAVEKTVVEQSKGATVKGFNEEKENGQTTYEVEMVVNGHSKDVQMDASGVVIETEEQVSIDALSKEIKTGLEAKAGKGKIMKVESITKKGKLVAFEAQVVTDGKKSEVQVGPAGMPLDHEE
jgi:hypothetical protein